MIADFGFGFEFDHGFCFWIVFERTSQSGGAFALLADELVRADVSPVCRLIHVLFLFWTLSISLFN